MSFLRSGVAAQFGGLPRETYVIFAGVLVNRVGHMIVPFLVFFLAARGVTPEQTPWVLGALGAGHLVGPMLGGLLADRLGRRPTMLVGLVGTAVAQGALFAAPNAATLALAAMFLSTTGALAAPAAFALLADLTRPERRRHAYALLNWGINIGTAVAGALGGFLAEQGYWLLFAVDAVSVLTYAAVVVARLPADRPRERAAGQGGGYGIVLRDRVLMLLVPLLGVQISIYALTEVALPLAIRDDGLSPAVYGAMAMLNALLVVLVQPLATGALSRFPQIPVYVVTSLTVAAGVAATGLADSAAAYAVTVALWSLGEAGMGGIAASLVANLAPAHAQGRYQGAFQWTVGSARFLAMTAGTALYTHVAPSALWWTAAVAGVVAALGILALSPLLNRASPVRPVVHASIPAETSAA